MHVFRLVSEQYSHSLSASGRAGRWNLDEQQVIYAGSSRALTALEWLTKSNAVNLELNYKMLVIAVPDAAIHFSEMEIKKLPSDWRSLTAYPELQKKGSDWYVSKRSLILKVPSSVITAETNFVINTQHPEFHSGVKIVRVEDFPWDKRLLR